MTDHDHLSTLISPLITQFQSKSVLIVGETAQNCYQNDSKAQLQSLQSPFHIDQLATLQAIDLAIVSEVTDILTKSEATQWLGTLRNRYTAHIILISDSDTSTQQDWQLNDYLALGMRQVKTTGRHQLFVYALESYQRKKDWLNSKHWANPERFDKHRW
ncbi:MAG: hypothetical protein COA63_002735 [Methylophaga sp.]|nr:hypothetical protein [Methylophaga sp.]